MPQSEKLAILLSFLGDDALEAAIAKMNGTASAEVTAALSDFKTQPPTREEVEFVIDDFSKYFRFAMKTAEHLVDEDAADPQSNGQSKTGVPDLQILQVPEEEFEVEIEPTKKFTQPTLTGNTVIDLNRLHPYRVAYALQNENPTTIAMTISSLATEHAAKTLEYLPDAMRPAVFLRLAQPTQVTPVIRDVVLETTLANGLKVEQRQPIEDTVEQMVTLMRTVPKSVRVPMLDELLKTDEALGNQVKSKLYQFDDMNRLNDRDIQQVLGQVNTESLVLALQNVDQELVDRIFSNMSKRAREALAEEMTYKTDATQDEIDSGRADVVKVLVTLEEAGTISME